MSERQARAARLVPPKRKPKGRPAHRDGATSRCVRHDLTFTTDADENRHVNAHHGCRIESVQ